MEYLWLILIAFVFVVAVLAYKMKTKKTVEPEALLPPVAQPPPLEEFNGIVDASTD